MDHNNTKRNNIYIFGFLFLTATVMITICSRSSFLYPLNDWNDANCFFTVGKSIFSGKVLYRDIFEQKGILVFVIYGLASLLSKQSFFGVYLIEIVCFFAFLCLVWRTLILFMKRGLAATLCPLLAALLCSTRAFDLGGGVEELALAVLYYPIYVLVTNSVVRKDYIPQRGRLILLGCGSALLLWSKFTLVGIYIGYVLFAIIYLISRKETGRLFCSAGFFLLGFLIVTLPVFLYFLLNDALGDMWTTYFYNNIFLYSAVERNIHHYLKYRALAIWQNFPMMLLITVSVVWVLRAPYGKAFRWGMFSLYFCNVFFIYIAGVAYEYYAMGVAPLSVMGLVGCANLFRHIIPVYRTGRIIELFTKRIIQICTIAMIFVASCILAYNCSMNSFYMAYRAEDMWYTHFAERILASEDTSLFNYGCLDCGLYTVTGNVPTTEYFCYLNIPLQEMRDESERYIRDGEIEWVVTMRDEPLRDDCYELVMKEKSFARTESNPVTYYLYRRLEKAKSV